MACKPYPLFRLPGWNRLSAALHLDDRRKFYEASYLFNILYEFDQHSLYAYRTPTVVWTMNFRTHSPQVTRLDAATPSKRPPSSSPTTGNSFRTPFLASMSLGRRTTYMRQSACAVQTPSQSILEERHSAGRRATSGVGGWRAMSEGCRGQGRRPCPCPNQTRTRGMDMADLGMICQVMHRRGVRRKISNVI